MTITAQPLTPRDQARFDEAFKKFRAPENRKSANKADDLKNIIADVLSCDIAIAHITQRKNVTNRFNDQGRRNPSYTLLYVESSGDEKLNDEDLLGYVMERVDEYQNRFTDLTKMKAVFYFLPAQNGTGSMAYVIDFTDGSDPVVQTMMATFPASAYERRVSKFSHNPGSAANSPATEPSPTPVGGWMETSADLKLTDDPCDLVELGSAFAQAVAALRAGKHLLFIGPPGSAKTELAECLCNHPAVLYEQTVATAEWSTATVTGGYLQVSDGENQVIDFVPGLATAAMQDGKWLIIDEFNRADMDKAFGELFNVLLGKTVRLPFLKRDDEGQLPVYIGNDVPENSYQIPCPKDWRLVAAMNSFDKFSLSKLSLALMRRFAAIPIELPSPDGYKKVLQKISEKLLLKNKLEGLAESIFIEIRALLEDIFAENGSGTLRGLELGVGPSIPIDILYYAIERIRFSTESAASIIAEGCRLFLFPQYEGRDGSHDAVIALLAQTLGFKKDSVEWGALNRSLAIYTGQVPR